MECDLAGNRLLLGPAVTGKLSHIYWWNFYTILEGRACFAFVDPRISYPLTKIGMKFVLSLMNERIRVPDPDFADARLLVMQFSKSDDGKRKIRLHDFDDSDSSSFDQLNSMIDETYRL
jgi:hypothetical protein